MSLWGRVGVGCRQQLPSAQLSRPALCQEGRESWHSYCSPAQMPVCLHPSRLPLCSPLSPDLTGVAGWGAGQGPGCLGLRVSGLISFPVVLSAPLLLHQYAHPRCPVYHLHSSSKHLLSAFVRSVMCSCVMCLALALVFLFGRLLLSLLPSSSPWKLIKEQSLAETIPSPLPSPMARNSLSSFASPMAHPP